MHDLSAYLKGVNLGEIEMRMMLYILVSFSTAAFALSPYKQSLTTKTGHYMNDGVFTGGRAGSGTTLLGIRRAYSAKAKIERVIIDLGDKDGKSPGRNPGYYQASIDQGNKRITVDLAQLKMSHLTEQKLKDLF